MTYFDIFILFLSLWALYKFWKHIVRRPLPSYLPFMLKRDLKIMQERKDYRFIIVYNVEGDVLTQVPHELSKKHGRHVISMLPYTTDRRARWMVSYGLRYNQAMMEHLGV